MSFPERCVPLPFRIDLSPIDEFDFDEILSASRGSRCRVDYAYRGKRNSNSREISDLSGDAYRAKGSSSSREIGGLSDEAYRPMKRSKNRYKDSCDGDVRPMRKSKNKYQDDLDGGVHQPKQHSSHRDNHYVSAFDGHVNRTAEHLKRPRLDEEKFYGDVIPTIKYFHHRRRYDDETFSGDLLRTPQVSSSRRRYQKAINDRPKDSARRIRYMEGSDDAFRSIELVPRSKAQRDYYTRPPIFSSKKSKRRYEEIDTDPRLEDIGRMRRYRGLMNRQRLW